MALRVADEAHQIAGHGDVGLVAVLLEEQPLQHPGPLIPVLAEQGSSVGQEPEDGVGLGQHPAVVEHQ
jgi:hypothetical protein